MTFELALTKVRKLVKIEITTMLLYILDMGDFWTQYCMEIIRIGNNQVVKAQGINP